MSRLRQQLLIVVSISATLFMTAQTQIGNDIDGVLSGDLFGTNVSLSADGNIVALTSSIVGSNGGGRIRVFKNISGTWTLYGTDINGENFGGGQSLGLSLSADGNTLAISNGSVKIFSYDTNTEIWSQKGSDISNSTSASQFGYSLKLSEDGNTVAIGATSSPFVPEAGVTQIFQFETDSWNQIGNDINGIVATEHSGRSVDLSSDGNIVSIANDNSIRVYQNVSNNWLLLGDEILATGSQSPNSRVSLSSNGNILAVGEPDFTDNLIQRGRVRMFNYVAGEWNQVGNSILGEVAYYRTGWSVSLSHDAQTLAIGETGSTSGSTDKGRTRIFKNQDNTWVQVGSDILGEASEDHSGWGVSLSSDASKIAIGSPYSDGGGLDSGQARVYDLSATLSLEDVLQPTITLFPNPSREQFTVQLPEGVNLKNVTLYNSLGELIYSSTSNTVDTSKLASGVYYVDVTSSKGKVTKKVLVH